jgi:hypothetical protein
VILLRPHIRSCPAAPAAFSRRGAAEIELIYIIPIFLTIVFLLGAMMVLGPARILNIVTPNEMAYRDATAANAPQLSGAPGPDVVPDPLLAINTTLTTELPNRVNTAESDKTLAIKVGLIGLPSMTLVNQAAYISPTWAYSSWPDAGDAPTLETWFQEYAEQSKDTVEDPLKLSPAWPP